MGKKGPPRIVPDQPDRDRYYSRVSDHDEVYLIDSGVVDVVKDLLREHRRKATGDDAKDERTERIEQERGSAPALPTRPPGPPKPPTPGMKKP